MHLSQSYNFTITNLFKKSGICAFWASYDANPRFFNKQTRNAMLQIACGNSTLG